MTLDNLPQMSAIGQEEALAPQGHVIRVQLPFPLFSRKSDRPGKRASLWVGYRSCYYFSVGETKIPGTVSHHRRAWEEGLMGKEGQGDRQTATETP